MLRISGPTLSQHASHQNGGLRVTLRQVRLPMSERRRPGGVQLDRLTSWWGNTRGSQRAWDGCLKRQVWAERLVIRPVRQHANNQYLWELGRGWPGAQNPRSLDALRLHFPYSLLWCVPGATSLRHCLWWKWKSLKTCWFCRRHLRDALMSSCYWMKKLWGQSENEWTKL